ncbi:hypothetical protein DPMN_149548 [Dreissena polymorpha]|uniref:BPTI/Kunitz inhibitor domain-containing protein n=1 Tax=Dreissena polymorpha TaxID=45954 RepID=A0A9D4FBJ7_DREPO|nr:hypothetical protein DPMN_149548 [Dreissena polymorpha]
MMYSKLFRRFLRQVAVAKMGKVVVAFLFLATVICVIAAQESRHGLPYRCRGPRPHQGNCFRADHMWHFNGYRCVKLPLHCYTTNPNSNAFGSKFECKRLCEGLEVLYTQNVATNTFIVSIVDDRCKSDTFDEARAGWLSLVGHRFRFKSTEVLRKTSCQKDPESGYISNNN